MNRSAFLFRDEQDADADLVEVAAWPGFADRFTPFHAKVIAANAANAANAAHVLDGLLDHESELVIREHATDAARAVDHVFGPCHLPGLRFAPRIRDFNERRLYGLSPLDPWPTLRPAVRAAIEGRPDGRERLCLSLRAHDGGAGRMAPRGPHARRRGVPPHPPLPATAPAATCGPSPPPAWRGNDKAVRRLSGRSV